MEPITQRKDTIIMFPSWNINLFYLMSLHVSQKDIKISITVYAWYIYIIKFFNIKKIDIN